METANATAPSHRRAIATAIATELHRQGHSADIDVEAVAEAVERALAPHLALNEGRRPDELNATNDD